MQAGGNAPGIDEVARAANARAGALSRSKSLSTAPLARLFNQRLGFRGTLAGLRGTLGTEGGASFGEKGHRNLPMRFR